MFGISWSEFIVVAILALVILGPERLPALAKQLGKWVREIRLATANIRSDFAADLRGKIDETPDNTSVTKVSQTSSTVPSVSGFGEPVRHTKQQPMPDTTKES